MQGQIEEVVSFTKEGAVFHARTKKLQNRSRNNDIDDFAQNIYLPDLYKLLTTFYQAVLSNTTDFYFFIKPVAKKLLTQLKTIMFRIYSIFKGLDAVKRKYLIVFCVLFLFVFLTLTFSSLTLNQSVVYNSKESVKVNKNVQKLAKVSREEIDVLSRGYEEVESKDIVTTIKEEIFSKATFVQSMSSETKLTTTLLKKGYQKQKLNKFTLFEVSDKACSLKILSSRPNDFIFTFCRILPIQNIKLKLNDLVDKSSCKSYLSFKYFNKNTYNSDIDHQKVVINTLIVYIFSKFDSVSIWIDPNQAESRTKSKLKEILSFIAFKLSKNYKNILTSLKFTYFMNLKDKMMVNLVKIEENMFESNEEVERFLKAVETEIIKTKLRNINFNLNSRYSQNFEVFNFLEHEEISKKNENFCSNNERISFHSNPKSRDIDHFENFQELKNSREHEDISNVKDFTSTISCGSEYFKLERNVEILGNDVDDTLAHSLQQCCIICVMTTECNAFSFLSSHRRCWLKSISATTSQADIHLEKDNNFKFTSGIALYS